VAWEISFKGGEEKEGEGEVPQSPPFLPNHRRLNSQRGKSLGKKREKNETESEGGSHSVPAPTRIWIRRSLLTSAQEHEGVKNEGRFPGGRSELGFRKSSTMRGQEGIKGGSSAKKWSLGLGWRKEGRKKGKELSGEAEASPY